MSFKAFFEKLLGKASASRSQAIKAVVVFVEEGEWTKSALHVDPTLFNDIPKGLIGQVDRGLHLNGALKTFSEKQRPQIRKATGINPSRLTGLVAELHPHTPFAYWRVKSSIAIYWVAVIGLAQPGAVPERTTTMARPA